ncbi:MAG: hypothetical protein ACPL3Q_09855 [Candidatus Ratteibacteria bacterium]
MKICHSFGMKVIPYFSGWELSPETKIFSKNWEKWYAPCFENGYVRYTHAGQGKIYGALMCPDSGWKEYLEEYIKKIIDTYDFDGCYIDWSAPGVCFNYGHFPGIHTGTCGLIDFFENIRKFLKDKILVIHSGGQSCWLFHHNIADRIVTLEEGKRESGEFVSLKEYPFSIRFMNSGSVGIVPDVFYLSDILKFKRGLSHLVHLDTLPYIYEFSGPSVFGYKNWKDFINDKTGLFSLFEKYSKIDFTKYKFFGPHESRIIKNNTKDILASLYISKNNYFVIISNQTENILGKGEIFVSINNKKI